MLKYLEIVKIFKNIHSHLQMLKQSQTAIAGSAFPPVCLGFQDQLVQFLVLIYTRYNCFTISFVVWIYHYYILQMKNLGDEFTKNGKFIP